ncbi:MAG: hypothetical protein ABL925_17195, partial [Methylococcales bacterium]
MCQLILTTEAQKVSMQNSCKSTDTISPGNKKPAKTCGLRVSEFLCISLDAKETIEQLLAGLYYSCLL